MARVFSPSIVPVPSWAFHDSISPAFGSTAMRWSASGPNVSIPAPPATATPIGTGVSGRSQIRAASTWKNSPRKSTRSPVWSFRMISMASASMS